MSSTECAQSLQMHHTQYDTVMSGLSVLQQEPAGPPPPSSFNIHTLRTRTWKWGRIYRAILLSHVVSSKCNIKKVRIYFCQATLMALYFQQKNNVTVQILPPRCLSILRFLQSSSQVVQCVQTVKNTAVQWFPTSARMLQLKKYYSCGKKRANG